MHVVKITSSFFVSCVKPVTRCLQQNSCAMKKLHAKKCPECHHPEYKIITHIEQWKQGIKLNIVEFRVGQWNCHFNGRLLRRTQELASMFARKHHYC